MCEFLIDSIFDMFDGRVYQKTVVIPKGTNVLIFSTSSFIRTRETSYRKTEKKANLIL
jgi:hypothetical protein